MMMVGLSLSAPFCINPSIIFRVKVAYRAALRRRVAGDFFQQAFAELRFAPTFAKTNINRIEFFAGRSSPRRFFPVPLCPKKRSDA